MPMRQVADNVHWLGAIDWDRRLFDSLIPLPDGTTYNAYLIQGSEKTALLDTVDPPMAEVLMAQLEAVPRIDYIVSQHAEPDHSGTIAQVLEKYPAAKVVVTAKAKTMLMDLFALPESVFVTVADKETLALGGKTLEFIHTPWVHWPETMVTYLQEDRILFTCDFYGSHIAASDLFVTDYATLLANALRPKAKFLSILGSYGWGGKTVESLAGMIPNLKVEVIDPVLCKGTPSPEVFEKLDQMARVIARKHKENGFV